jgi:hypothetical protein
VECVHCPSKVNIGHLFPPSIKLTSSLSDTDMIRCDKCRAAVADVESVVDATRVGQEGLEKATALQFQGKRHFYFRLVAKMLMILQTQQSPSN